MAHGVRVYPHADADLTPASKLRPVVAGDQGAARRPGARSEGIRQSSGAREMDDGARLPAALAWWRFRLARLVSGPSAAGYLSTPTSFGRMGGSGARSDDTANSRAA
jgi:hypothetical protein